MSALSGPVAGDGGETGTGARRDETERGRATEGADMTGGELREAIATDLSRHIMRVARQGNGAVQVTCTCGWDGGEVPRDVLAAEARAAEDAHRRHAADAVLALPALRDLIAERDTLAAQVQAVEGLHEGWPTEGDEISYCASCGLAWPCDTRRALGTPTTGGGE